MKPSSKRGGTGFDVQVVQFIGPLRGVRFCAACASNEADPPAVGHGIDDVRLIEQPRLQTARRLARRGDGHETAPGRQGGHLCGELCDSTRP